MGALTTTTAVGCGLAGGVLFAFSGFIMPALNTLKPAVSVAAMQSINRLAVTPPLMVLLFGTALAATATVIGELRTDGGPDPLVLAGCGVYLVGVIGVTIAGNVPLNDALALVDADGAGAAVGWDAFSGPWKLLNHVRTAAGLAAAVLVTVGSS